MSEQIVEVVKSNYSTRYYPGEKRYLFIAQSKMIFADFSPDVVQKKPSIKKTAAVAVLLGALGAGLYSASKSAKIVDTEEKKRLREIVEVYRKTRDKDILNSLTVEQITKADSTARLIPFSSVSKVSVKEPGRFKKGRITITHQVSDKSLTGKKYSRSITREFDIFENNELFSTLVRLLQQLLPSNVFN